MGNATCMPYSFFCITAKCLRNAQSNQTKFEGSWNFQDTEIQQNLLKSNLPCDGVDAPGKIVIRFGKTIDASFHADIALQKTSTSNTYNSSDFRKDYLLFNSLTRVDAIGAYGCFCWEIFSGVDYTGSKKVLDPMCQLTLSIKLGSFKRVRCEKMRRNFL